MDSAGASSGPEGLVGSLGSSDKEEAADALQSALLAIEDEAERLECRLVVVLSGNSSAPPLEAVMALYQVGMKEAAAVRLEVQSGGLGIPRGMFCSNYRFPV